ncbi:MAG: hypothetical protein IPF52_18815 [Saprospiraceae bacterium]|nr:hypothetical protein [Saprospiraceae bacterium]
MQTIRYIFIFLLVAGFVFAAIKQNKPDGIVVKNSHSSPILLNVNNWLRRMVVKDPRLASEVDHVIESKPYLKKVRQQFISEYYRKPMNGNAQFLDFMLYKRSQNHVHSSRNINK